MVAFFVVALEDHAEKGAPSATDTFKWLLFLLNKYPFVHIAMEPDVFWARKTGFRQKGNYGFHVGEEGGSCLLLNSPRNRHHMSGLEYFIVKGLRVIGVLWARGSDCLEKPTSLAWCTLLKFSAQPHEP